LLPESGDPTASRRLLPLRVVLLSCTCDADRRVAFAANSGVIWPISRLPGRKEPVRGRKVEADGIATPSGAENADIDGPEDPETTGGWGPD